MATVESYVPADLSYYVWWFPGSPLKVHLALNLVRQLSEQLRLAGPQAAGEGLLFGKVIEGTTEVLDFQSAPGQVPETVAALAQDGGKRVLVGYYRIETGNSLGLNESDLTLARTCFIQPYHVFLIIQASGFGPPNASFFFHDSNGKMPEFSLMEFPFEPSLMAGEESDRLKRSQEAAARRSAAIQPSAEPRLLPPLRFQFQPQPPFRPVWTSRVAVGLVLLFALLCGVGVSAGSRFLQAWWSRIRSARVDVPAPSPVAIGLSAKRQNADVEITWNRESPVIAGAISGVLSIQDGSSRRDIALDIDRIRNSSVVYSPVSDQVFLLLSVSTPVTTVSESVMMLLPRNGPPKLYASPGAKTPGSRTLKPFIPPPPVLNPSEPVMAQLPLPIPATKGATDRDSIPMVIAQPTLLPPPSAPPNDAQAVSAAKSVSYHAAEPLHRVKPRITPQLLAMLTKPATLEVRVTIDKTGRVTHAEAVPHAGVNKLVLEQVVAAARSWTFTPARRGDDPLSSEFVLQFYFGQ